MPTTLSYSQSAAELDKAVVVSVDGAIAGDTYSAALVCSLGLQTPFNPSVADNSGHASFSFTVRILDPVSPIPTTVWVFHIPQSGLLPALVDSVSFTLFIP